MFNTIKGIQLKQEEKDRGVVEKSVLLTYLKAARALVVDNLDVYKEAKEAAESDYKESYSKWKQERSDLLQEILMAIDPASLVESEQVSTYNRSLFRPDGSEITFSAGFTIVDPTLSARLRSLDQQKPEDPSQYSFWAKDENPNRLYNLIKKLQADLDRLVLELEERKSTEIQTAKVVLVVETVDRQLARLNLSL